eukprot:scaffold30950_cov48-Attheya_sp.AAC.2
MESLVPIGHMRDLSDHHVLVRTVGRTTKPIENTRYLELIQDFEDEASNCKNLEMLPFRKNMLYILRDIMKFQFVKEDTLTHSLYEIGDKEVLEMLKVRYSQWNSKDTLPSN